MTDEPVESEGSESSEESRPRPSAGQQWSFTPPPAGMDGYAVTMQPRRRRSVVWTAIKIIMLLLVFGILFGMGALFGVICGFTAATDDGVFTSGAKKRVSEMVWESGSSTEQIAIIPISGLIDSEMMMFIHHCVETVLADVRVKAVVLRVQSGGGHVGPSEQIWHELGRLREAGKVVICSYGSVAASGGYYVSCGSDYIFAEPTCLTGSIGVIAQVLTLEQTMEKLGIAPVTITATKAERKDIANNIFRQWGEADIEKVTSFLDIMHDRFIEVVREGRGEVMGDEEIEVVMTGEVFMAHDALEAKLVDGIGYLDDAITKAKSELSITNPRVVLYGVRMGLLGELLGVEQRGGGESCLTTMDAAALRKMVIELSSPQFMYYYSP